MRDYYKILEVGSSGKGKTYSFRNMNSTTTGFINIENKPLPFKNSFKFHSRPIGMEEVKKCLKEYADNNEINAIVIDSLSAYMDIVLTAARATKKGFDIWNFYNEEIAKFINFIKTIQKEVFITAHYEWLQGEEGVKERRVKVKGKEWEGLIEKEFTLVLYADNEFKDKKVTYFFNTALENSSAKCPPGIFGEDTYKIDNDANYVLTKIIEFTK